MSYRERKPFYSGLLIIAAGSLLFYLIKPYAPQRLFSESIDSKGIVVDSLMLLAIKESQAKDIEPNDTASYTNPVKKDSSTTVKKSTKSVTTTPIVEQLTPAHLISINDFKFDTTHSADSLGRVVLPKPIVLNGYNGIVNIRSFLKKLHEVNRDSSKSVRIAYYGDSMIDGDLIVQDLRRALQDRFGGRGVGFVSIDSESARSRYSVKHRVSGSWKGINYMRTKSDSLNYGINGAVFYAQDSTAQLHYAASGIKNAYRLNSPQLFYGTGNDTAQVVVKKDRDTLLTTIALDGKKQVNTVTLSSYDLKSLNLDFSKATNVPLYGVDFFNDEGVTIDGFSNRGNSGLPLSLLKKDFIKGFNTSIKYDLVILQFGANVLSTQSSSFNWYASRMSAVVSHLQSLYPDADFLILGTADKGSKIENLVRTDSTVVRLLKAQQKYAHNTKSGFVSLFHLMGGVNSMSAWQEHGLANSDFTHFSPKGSRIIGSLIYEELMRYYDSYVLEESVNQPDTKKYHSLDKDAKASTPQTSETAPSRTDTLKTTAQ